MKKLLADAAEGEKMYNEEQLKEVLSKHPDPEFKCYWFMCLRYFIKEVDLEE